MADVHICGESKIINLYTVYCNVSISSSVQKWTLRMPVTLAVPPMIQVLLARFLFIIYVVCTAEKTCSWHCCVDGAACIYLGKHFGRHFCRTVHSVSWAGSMDNILMHLKCGGHTCLCIFQTGLEWHGATSASELRSRKRQSCKVIHFEICMWRSRTNVWVISFCLSSCSRTVPIPMWPTQCMTDMMGGRQASCTQLRLCYVIVLSSDC